MLFVLGVHLARSSARGLNVKRRCAGSIYHATCLGYLCLGTYLSHLVL